MRAVCLGLLLLLATASGCANLDDGGFMENYNGFPWPWLMTKAPSKGRADTLVQHPGCAPTGRFARSPADATDTASSDNSTALSSTPIKPAAGELPVDESPPKE